MRLLVTGGFGFIGSNFVRHVLEGSRDTNVVIVDKLSHGSDTRNLAEADKSRFRIVRGDICDSKLTESLVEEVDAIVNFAAETHVDRSISNPLPFQRSNVEGVVSILEALRKKGNQKRLVEVSTDEVYGDTMTGSSSENDALRPSSPYAASKAAGDLFCLAYARTYGLDVLVTRCANNFGPFQFPEKLIPKTIVRAKRDLRVPIYGKGRNVRDWLYVLDHCRAIERVLEKGRKGEIYNISGGNELENTELVRRILSLMRKPDSLIEFVEDRPGHDLRYSINSGKIRKELGWRAEVEFGQALDVTVQWYLSNQSWWEPLVTPEVVDPTPWKSVW